MKHSKTTTGILASIFLLILIFDSKTAIGGASEGLQVCIETVIPSLFPFFVASVILTGILMGHQFSGLGPLRKRLGIPQGAESLFLVGLLGGYPVGAQCIAQACQAGQLSRQDGERMLSFCSNAGPAFIFGIGATLFPNIWMCWVLWLIHVLSALIVGAMTPTSCAASSLPSGCRAISLSEALHRSIKTMGMVCGWIVLLRTIINFCQRWFLWLLPSNLSLFVTGLLELTNGCLLLNQVSSLGLRMELFSLLLGFGGLCVLLQTKSALTGSGLKGKAYFPGKLTQSAISYLLALLVQFFLPEQMRYFPSPYQPLVAITLCAAYYFYSLKGKKSSSIPQVLRV